MPHRLTWYGHSNFKLETASGKALLIDPFFAGNPNAPIGADAVGEVDCICLTHDHSDHTGQAVDIAKATGATVVGVYDTIQKLTGQGLPEGQALGMNIGGTIQIADARIKMVQAVHSTASGAATGYIITLRDGFCLYDAGDTGLFASMELFARFHEIDLAILPIGGHFTMDPEQAAYACKLLKPAWVVPMHWGTFPVLEQNTEAFAEQLAKHAPDTRLFPLTPGQSMALSKGEALNDCRCE